MTGKTRIFHRRSGPRGAMRSPSATGEKLLLFKAVTGGRNKCRTEKPTFLHSPVCNQKSKIEVPTAKYLAFIYLHFKLAIFIYNRQEVGVLHLFHLTPLNSWHCPNMSPLSGDFAKIVPIKQQHRDLLLLG